MPVQPEQTDGLLAAVLQDQPYRVGTRRPDGQGVLDRLRQLRYRRALQQPQHLDELPRPLARQLSLQPPPQYPEAVGQLPALQRPGEVQGPGLAFQEGQVMDRIE